MLHKQLIDNIKLKKKHFNLEKNYHEKVVLCISPQDLKTSFRHLPSRSRVLTCCLPTDNRGEDRKEVGSQV